MLLAEMVWITADQSHFFFDFSPVRMLTMWLRRTSYIATINKYIQYYYFCVKTMRALTYSVCMNHTKTQELLLVPINNFGGRTFTTINSTSITSSINSTTAVQAQTQQNAFSWAENTARGVRFSFGFNMYLFLAQ